MKTSIVIVIVIIGLTVSGCGNATYLSLTGNNREQIEEQLRYNEKDEDVGVVIVFPSSHSNGILVSPTY